MVPLKGGGQMKSYGIFAWALAFALAWTPLGAGAQPTRTPERQAMLDRLSVALPPSGATIEETARIRRARMQDLESQFMAHNAGRETDVSAILDGYALCVATAIHDQSLNLVLTAADLSLSDTELENMIGFYSGPDHPRFSEISERMQRGEPVSDEDRRFVNEQVAEPATQRFARQLQETAANFARSPEGTRLLDTCARAMVDAAATAGINPP
ncbi:MAG: hypothetical protein NT015_16785 [Alphaproteobacteria bacterium]|nr:hypothetical protein [Alphaproteobacteria bacterium]